MARASDLRLDILSSIFAKGWAGVLLFLSTPLYLKLMGLEAFGLVGILATIQNLFAVLDLGMSVSLNRELAVRLDRPGEEEGAARWETLRSLERVYGGIVVVTGSVLAVSSPWLAHRWFNTEALSTSSVALCLVFMAFTAGFQMLMGFYAGGLAGLHQQTRANVATMLVSTLRLGGALAVLLVADRVELFFLWHAVSMGVGAWIMSFLLRRRMGAAGRGAGFNWRRVRGLRGFLGGMGAIMLTGMMISQADKVLLSNWLPMERFGVYSTAFTLYGFLLTGVAALLSVAFPRIVRVTAQGDDVQLARYYDSFSQALCLVALPAGIVLAVFPEASLFAWTGNAQVADQAAIPLCFLALGTCLHAFIHLPSFTLIAQGRTRLNVGFNLALLAFQIPYLFVMMKFFGVAGAATGWIAVNAGYFFVMVPLMHRTMLPGHYPVLLRNSLAPGVLLAGLCALCRVLLGWPQARLSAILFLVALWVILALLAVAVLPAMRRVVLGRVISRLSSARN